MKEAYKLVVSYAEGDNAASENGKGWVTDFCKFLELFTNRLSKFEIKVVTLKDLKDQKGKNIALPIFSPNYLSSDQCKKELNQLTELTNNIFRVQKQPVANKELPAAVVNEIAYKFYERSIESDSGYIEYRSTSLNRYYWLKLVDLAYDIVQNIAIEEHLAKEKEGEIVYLAETTFDQESNRDTLRRELQRFGHTILPNHPLPEDSTKLKAEIEAYLEKCTIAIHMVGAHYGKNINGTEMSIVEYQNKTAGEFAEKKFEKSGELLKRYLWSPPHIKAADEKQMLYFDRLKEEADKSTNAEIIQVPLENLKSIVEKNLDVFKSNLQSSLNMKANENGQLMVYLIYDKEDEKDLDGLKAKLEKENIKVFAPVFTGNQLELLHQHRQNLINADAVFIYSNTSNQFWLNSKVNDLIKSPGFGRQKPYKVQALCVPNGKVSADGFKEFSDILAFDKLNDASIDSFLVKLK